MRPPARHSRTAGRLETALFELAPRKGYSLEDAVVTSNSPAKRRYHLRSDFTHKLVTRESGSAAWSIEAAVKFLRTQPDVD